MHLIQLYQFTINESGNINTDAPGVPLIYVDADGKTEEEIASAKGRNTVGVVFAQIEADLLKAVEIWNPDMSVHLKTILMPVLQMASWHVITC